MVPPHSNRPVTKTRGSPVTFRIHLFQSPSSGLSGTSAMPGFHMGARDLNSRSSWLHSESFYSLSPPRDPFVNSYRILRSYWEQLFYNCYLKKNSAWGFLRFEFEMSLTGFCGWTLGPQLLVVVWKVVEPLGWKVWLVEASSWWLAFEDDSLTALLVQPAFWFIKIWDTSSHTPIHAIYHALPTRMDRTPKSESASSPLNWPSGIFATSRCSVTIIKFSSLAWRLLAP